MSKILDLAKNGIYYRPLDTGPAVDAVEEDGDFVRGLKKAGHQIPQTAGGAVALVGDAIGSDGMREYGMDVYQKRADQIQAISKPSDSLSSVLEGEGSAADWLQNSAGYVTGQVGSALVTGGVGGFIGKQLAQRGIKHIIERGATSKIAADVAAKVGRRGAMIGAGTAMFGQNLTQEAGSIYPEAVHHAEAEGRTLDGGDLGRVAGSAVVAAGVDTAMDALMMGRVMSGGRRAVRNEAGEVVTESMLRAARRELPMAMAREGVTEGIQTGIERYGAQKELGTADAVREYVDSIGVGVVGGGMGGALSVLHAQKVPDAGPLSRAANTAIDQEILQLTNDPEPLIVFPDGTTGHKAEFEAYLKQFPEENGERNAARAKLLGLDGKTGEPLEQEAPPEPEFAATQAEQDARLADYAAEHEPATLEYAHSLLAAPGAKGKKLMVAPHPSGDGYTVVPSNWLTLDAQATLGSLQKPQPAAPKEKGKKPAAAEPAPVGQPDTAWQDNPYTAFKFADAELAEKFMANKGADPEKFWVQPQGEQFVIKAKTVAPAAVVQDAAPALPEAAATIYNPVGQPFVTEFSAKLRLKKGGFADTHEVVAVDDGFVLQPKEATNGAGATAVPENGSAGRVDGDRPAGRAAPVDGLGSGANDGSAEPAPAADAIADPNPEPDPVHATGGANAEPALAAVAGEPIDAEWTAFKPETGTLNVERAAMPQVKAEHRGALVNFLNARGIAHQQEEIPAADLKPTQREFSPAKVQKAREFVGGERSILISADNHVLDGHHQWLAKLDASEPVKVIRLDAPIAQLIDDVKEFPSAATEESTNVPEPTQVPEETPVAQGAQGEAQAAAEPVKTGNPMMDDPASWVIREKDTGKAIMETFDRKKVDALNTAKYEAVPAYQHLQEVNDPESLAGKDARAEPAPADGIPKAFYKKVRVPHEVYDAETDTTATEQVPADEALAAVREEQANLKALIKCMKGA